MYLFYKSRTAGLMHTFSFECDDKNIKWISLVTKVKFQFQNEKIPCFSSCYFRVDVLVPHVVDGAAGTTHDDGTGPEKSDQL